MKLVLFVLIFLAGCTTIVSPPTHFMTVDDNGNLEEYVEVDGIYYHKIYEQIVSSDILKLPSKEN